MAFKKNGVKIRRKKFSKKEKKLQEVSPLSPISWNLGHRKRSSLCDSYKCGNHIMQLSIKHFPLQRPHHESSQPYFVKHLFTESIRLFRNRSTGRLHINSPSPSYTLLEFLVFYILSMSKPSTRKHFHSTPSKHTSL